MPVGIVLTGVVCLAGETYNVLPISMVVVRYERIYA